MAVEAKRGVGGLETFVLRAGDAEAEVVPERGALVARLRVGGEELLYLDEATVADRVKNVRGGIPVLFPIAGKLPGNRYAMNGASYELPQHGFARASAWRVTERGPASLECTLASSAETKRVWPFDFVASVRVALQADSLTIVLAATNGSNVRMPFHAGFHPYFFVPSALKAEAHVETDATRGYDNRGGLSGPIGTIDFSVDELDLHLEDHRAKGTVLHRGALAPIRLAWSDNVSRLVLWEVAGKDYVCVEPWTARGGALAGKAPELPWIEPGASAAVSLTIRRG